MSSERRTRPCTEAAQWLVRQCVKLMNVGLGTPPPKPKAKSRVPSFLQKARLDGRRR